MCVAQDYGAASETLSKIYRLQLSLFFEQTNTKKNAFATRKL
jgi:hypothetical protein